MKAHTIRRDAVTAETLQGLVLTRDLGKGEERLRKGQILVADDIPRLLGLPWQELHLLELEPGELHEEEAGRRLATAVAGDGVVVREMAGGQWPLTAARKGLLRVDAEGVDRINALEGCSFYTLYDRVVVMAGEPVARAKITPFAIAGQLIEEAQAIARARQGLIRVLAFRPVRIGAVVKESLDPSARERFQTALGEKLGWFGATLLPVQYVPETPAAIAQATRELRENGAELLLMAGASAMDPLDPIFVALERLGGRMEKHGVPAHPGSLLWLARLGDHWVVGVPTCGMFSQATVFDVLLPQILAGLPVDRGTLVGLGVGGFLTREVAFRFPPYRDRAPRGEITEERRVQS
jgi:hypothetical protein